MCPLPILKVEDHNGLKDREYRRQVSKALNALNERVDFRAQSVSSSSVETMAWTGGEDTVGRPKIERQSEPLPRMRSHLQAPLMS